MKRSFDTAMPRALGDRTTQVKPLLVFSWDAGRWLTLAPNTVYNASVSARPGAAVSNLELNVPFILLMPHRSSVTVEYKGTIDFERDNQCSNTLKVGTGKLLSERIHVYGSVEVPLNAATANFRTTVGMSFFFK